jgi:hypothetical protein
MHGNRSAHRCALILIAAAGLTFDTGLRAAAPQTPAASAASGGTPASADSSPAASQQDGAPHPGDSADNASPRERQPALYIGELLVAPSGKSADKEIALNDKLAIVLDAPSGQPAEQIPYPADQYVLFLNDFEVQGLEPAVYTTLTNAQHSRALVFRLVRNSNNAPFWRDLLGSPQAPTARVTVGLGVRQRPCRPAEACSAPDITIRGKEGPIGFEFTLFSWLRLGIAALAVALVLAVVWGHARTSTTLRDNLVPQLPPGMQPYSLGRWQMAFWFVLIFASFVFLYVFLWDYNTISPQALALMGISGATALAAVAVDVVKDSPADLVNRALRALGLNTYADVVRIAEEIESRKTQVLAAQQDFNAKDALARQAQGAAAASSPPDARLSEAAKTSKEIAAAAEEHLKRLQAEIQDRNNILRTYEDKTKLFRSEGWFKDITTDLNGPTLHRIQVVCWTAALGIVFLIGVYRDLAMSPEFSTTLLALMGISSAGYIGFKLPEKNT